MKKNVYSILLVCVLVGAISAIIWFRQNGSSGRNTLALSKVLSTNELFSNDFYSDEKLDLKKEEVKESELFGPPLHTFDEDPFDRYEAMNTVDAHDECAGFVGNFTGEGEDTIWIEFVGKEEGWTIEWELRSSNEKIPRLKLIGESPSLVDEGDLDGNGTCEFGCLDTGHNSQWRTYRIYTLVDYEWRYLVYGDYLFTPEWLRHSGVEIAEPGKEKGTVLIHWCGESNALSGVICDTIVAPTFDKIEDD